MLKKKGPVIRFCITAVIAAMSFVLNRFASSLPQSFLTFWRDATLRFFNFASLALSGIRFSVAELLLYALALAAVIGLTTAIIAAVAHNESVSLASFFSHLTLCAASLVFIYYALFGMWTFAETPLMPPLEPVRPTAELIYQTAADMQSRANALAAKVVRREDGSVDFGGFERLSGLVAEAYLPRVAALGFSEVAPPKQLIWKSALSYCGITGIFIPFTSEAHANADMPELAIPFTMAHELSHRYGVPNEDICNYLAYDLLTDCGRDDLAYSAAFTGYIYLSNALYEADPALWLEFKAGESVELARDLGQNAAYWKAFEGPIQDTASGLNDLHIRLDGDPDGEKSYSRIVNLLVSRYAAGTGGAG